VEKCVRAGQVTDDDITERMLFARCITKAAGTYSEYVIFLLFHSDID
jgi:hypothetical protein